VDSFPCTGCFCRRRVVESSADSVLEVSLLSGADPCTFGMYGGA